MLINKNLIIALNTIKIGYINRKPTVKIYNTSHTFFLCWKLLNLGFFNRIEQERGSNKFILHLRYFRSKPVFQNIKILYSPRRPEFISLWRLKRYYKNKIVLVSTSSGIILRSECLTKRTGGVLFAQFN